MKFKLQKYAELDLDAVFERFYDVMLSNADFSKFFTDQQQIKSLVAKQKQFLLDSIPLDDTEIAKRYIALGEYHDQIKVPFVDYIAATNILEQGLIHALVKRNEAWEMLEMTFHFFKMIRSYTAKGYLNKLLEADSKDIDHYLAHIPHTSDQETLLATDRILWLKGIIKAIKLGDRTAAPAPEIPKAIIDTITQSVESDTELVRYAIEMADRMEQTARNLFYFLDSDSYLEALPLYRELMSIYKLTLMLVNLVTVVESDKALLFSAAKLEGALNSLSDIVIISDTEGRIVLFNKAFMRFHQINNKPECATAWAEFPAFVDVYAYGSNELLPLEQSPMHRALRGEIGANLELTLRLKDNQEFRVFLYSYTPIRDKRGEIMGAVVTGRDITEQKQAEQQLRVAATAFETQQGMLITDAEAIILQVNKAFTHITGYSAEEAIGQNPRLLSSGRHDNAFYVDMWEQINAHDSWSGEIWNRRKNGDIYPEFLTITVVKDHQGQVCNYVGTLLDISISKAAEQEIEQLAFYDPLTGLANRRLFADRLRQRFSSSNRSGHDSALLYLDIDNFKILNDTQGHRIGDLLLQEVAIRLSNCIREEDTVARLGGDEFVIMLVGLSMDKVEAAAQAELIGHKILNAFEQPFQLETQSYPFTSSIGIILFKGQEEDKLLQQADIAMYQAKKTGGNTLRFFDEAMQETITKRVNLEKELREAIAHQQFQLYYQIQTDSIGSPISAEALIRWNHPERGLVPPFEFIALAEDTGLIVPIGQWVLETACAQLKTWQQDASTRDLTLSINVSAKQFFQADFVSQVQAVVSEYAINPEQLELELTESLLVDSLENAVIIMNKLKALGIRFSLDDFGTGYSSLQYLKQLPLAQLKIDQSFVRDLVTDPQDRAIVKTIIAMTQTLGLGVIAEGVETEDQWRLLLNKGCNHFQGYLFGKPVPLEEFERIIKKV